MFANTGRSLAVATGVSGCAVNSQLLWAVRTACSMLDERRCDPGVRSRWTIPKQIKIVNEVEAVSSDSRLESGVEAEKAAETSVSTAHR